MRLEFGPSPAAVGMQIFGYCKRSNATLGNAMAFSAPEASALLTVRTKEAAKEAGKEVERALDLPFCIQSASRSLSLYVHTDIYR